MSDTFPQIKCMIFDLDGTLADTLPVSYAAFRKTLQKYTGRTYSDQEIHGLFGPSEDGILQKIVGGDWQDAFDYYSACYEEAHDLCPAPFPGIPELLNELIRRDVKVAIVTGKGARSACFSLTWLKLDSQIKIVEAGSPTGSVKPEAIRKVLGMWKMDAGSVAYVGDSPSDVTAAREAGVIPVAVAWAPEADAEKLRVKEPAALLATTAELADWTFKRTR